MAITQQQIEETCGKIERGLAAFAGDAARVIELQNALVWLQWLRQQYRDNRALLDPFVQRLQDYGQQITQAVRSARGALAAEYLRAGQAVQDWERRREACRDALVELARADKLDRFESSDGWIEVRAFRGMSLPKPGTPQRAQLGELITQAGRWPEVASPVGVRLLKALDDGLFAAEQAERLRALCPVLTVWRLTGHAQG